jgi:signal transduction histidine kinase/CheY-like chemotaxis protein
VIENNVKTHSLSRRTLGMVILSGFLISIIITLVQLSFTYKNIEKDLHNRLKSISKDFSTPIASTLWKYDLELLNNFTQSLLSQQSITSVTVRDEEAKEVIHNFKDKKFDNTFSLKIDLRDPVSNVEYIGFVVIDYTSDHKTKELLQRTLENFFVYLGISLIIAFIIYYIIDSTIISHINNMASSIKNQQLGEIPNFKITLDREKIDDELQLLVKSINETSFQVYFANLRNKKLIDKITKINNDLEVTVEHRTKELLVTMEELKKASDIKDKFLAHMSHEIRTPLNHIILGFDNLSSDNPKEKEESLSIIKSSTKNLLELVNQILDYSQFSRSELRPNLDFISLPELAEDMNQTFSYAMEDKGLKWHFSVDPNIPKSFYTDKYKIKQVLINFIRNAFKFTNSGDIKFSVESIKKNVIFTISDTGVGIPQEALRNIFNPFYQIDSTTTKRYQGSGLGLSISKAYIDLLEGTISSESTEGQGTTFTITLPVLKEPKAELEVVKNEAVEDITCKEGLKVLIVDDNKINLKLLKSALEKTGQVVTDYDSGLDVIENAKSTDYDIYILDVHMPEISGLEVLAELNKMEKKGVFVAYTADVTISKQDNNFDEVLTKPVTKKNIVELINKYFENKKAS